MRRWSSLERLRRTSFSATEVARSATSRRSSSRARRTSASICAFAASTSRCDSARAASTRRLCSSAASFSAWVRIAAASAYAARRRTSFSACWRAAASRSAGGGPRDDCTPDPDVTAVEDHGLTRADGALRGVEDDLRRVAFQRAHRRGGGLVAVANLGLDPQRRPRRLARDEIHRGRYEPAALEVRRLAHADRVALGVEVDDVERASRREAEPALLADGEGREPAVSSEPVPAPVDDRTGLEHLGGAPAQEAAVVVVRHEA